MIYQASAVSFTFSVALAAVREALKAEFRSQIVQGSVIAGQPSVGGVDAYQIVRD